MTDLRAAYGLISTDFQPTSPHPQTIGHAPVGPPSMMMEQRGMVDSNHLMYSASVPPQEPEVPPQSTFLKPPNVQHTAHMAPQQAQHKASTSAAAAATISMVPQVTVPVHVQQGYVDALASKKKDMAKLVLMALLILFAISAHSVIDFSMRNFIVDNGLSFRQEIGVRVLYPALVILIVWHLRAFGNAKRF